MLSPAEKQAGRTFRAKMIDNLAKLNEADPPDIDISDLLAVVRHACPQRAGRTTAITTDEWYVESPEYVVDGVTVASGLFGFIFRYGSCAVCGQTARSSTHRLVDTRQRPPLRGRPAREMSSMAKDNRVTDHSHESTWGATEAAKETWEDKHGNAARKRAEKLNDEAGDADIKDSA